MQKNSLPAQTLSRRAPEDNQAIEHTQQTCPPKAPRRRRIVAHKSPRTTKLYDGTSDQITLDEIERITI